MKHPYDVIIRPHITEKSMALSYGGDMYGDDETKLRKYTFVVSPDANKIEIARAIEEIYNAGKSKNEDKISVKSVNVINMKGKTRRIRFGARRGERRDWRKAIVTLAKGQMLEDYGV